MATAEQQAFLADAEPHVDALLELAKHDVAYHEARGDVPEGELTAEEVAGEALLRAFHERERKPDDVDLRAWLLAMEARVMDQLLDDDARDRELWELTLDAPLPQPPPPFGDDTYWDWHQPDESERNVATLPNPDATPAELVAVSEDLLHDLSPTQRKAWLLHDLHGLSVGEIVGILRHDSASVAAMIRKVRSELPEP